MSESEELTLAGCPFRLVYGGQGVWLEVPPRRPVGTGQVMITLDALPLMLEHEA